MQFAAVLYFFLRASIAARTFGGDIGSSVSRVPTARSIALAIAAIGGQMLTSAAPLAPYGWLGLATSTITGSIIGRVAQAEPLDHRRQDCGDGFLTTGLHFVGRRIG